MCGASCTPPTGDLACDLTGNWTSNPLIGRPTLNPQSHTTQGPKFLSKWVAWNLKHAFSQPEYTLEPLTFLKFDSKGLKHQPELFLQVISKHIFLLCLYCNKKWSPQRRILQVWCHWPGGINPRGEQSKKQRLGLWKEEVDRHWKAGLRVKKERHPKARTGRMSLLFLDFKLVSGRGWLALAPVPEQPLLPFHGCPLRPTFKASTFPLHLPLHKAQQPVCVFRGDGWVEFEIHKCGKKEAKWLSLT